MTNNALNIYKKWCDENFINIAPGCQIDVWRSFSKKTILSPYLYDSYDVALNIWRKKYLKLLN